MCESVLLYIPPEELLNLETQFTTWPIKHTKWYKIEDYSDMGNLALSDCSLLKVTNFIHSLSEQLAKSTPNAT